MAEYRRRLEFLDSEDRRERKEHAAAGTSPYIITPDSIAQVVARATQIPVTRLMSSDMEQLLRLEDDLSKTVSISLRPIL